LEDELFLDLVPNKVALKCPADGGGK